MTVPGDPGTALLIGAAGVLYLLGVRELSRRGRRWSPPRTAAFVAGLAVIAIATQTALAGEDDVRFSYHALEHVLLGMVAPALLSLGAPVTLALQAPSRATRSVLRRVVHGRAVGVLTHPVVAWLAFTSGVVALTLTPLLELSLRNDALHAASHLHLVVAGSLFCWTVVGVDPLPRRPPHGVRLLLVLLAVPVHAVVGVALLGADDVLPGGSWSLADQRVGAGLIWAVGDLAGLLLAGVVLVQWMRHEGREARREDQRLDAARAMGK